MLLKPVFSSGIILSFQLFISIPAAFSQQTTIVNQDAGPYHKVVIAGKQYKAGSAKSTFWGRHYRKEWTTPVKVPILSIDSAFGGLEPVETGGGRQTRTLRLKNAIGKEYVLRSVDKSFGKALPETFRGTFIEHIADDQVSISHPYSAVTVAPLAEAAGIYHTNPTIVFVPHGKNLGKYDGEFGDQLYLFEERPDDDQHDAKNFGNSKNVISTDKLLEEALLKNDQKVDQSFYIRSRLFDMFLSDWGRHEDQWRWASFDTAKRQSYRPIPRDRDQAYTLFDGLLVSAGSSFFQPGVESFNYKIKNIKTYNYPARYLDRRFTNETGVETWINEARDLKSRLTDTIIDQAIARLPPEVYPISGKTIAAKLKSRRDNLEKYAKDYYAFLSKEVDVVGSEKNEWFEVEDAGDGHLMVTVYDMEDGKTKGAKLYSRDFSPKETREIRIFGIDGNDHYVMNGDGKSSIKLRFIGGFKQDDYETVPGKKGIPVKVYDDRNNQFSALKKASLHLTEDPRIHAYDYKEFNYDKSGIKKGISYNNRDRIFLRTGYYFQKAGWRKLPFAYRHDLNLNYSLLQNAFSVEYRAIIIEAIGKWNVTFGGEYDGVRDFHYTGVGNETTIDASKRGFYRIKIREFNGGLGVNRSFGKYQTLDISAFYQRNKVLHDEDKNISKIPDSTGFYKERDYIGLRSEYRVMSLNDEVVPTKGIGFSTEISYTHPFDKTVDPFFRLGGTFGFYLPIFKNFSLVSKISASTLTNNTNDLYQMSKLGGAANFRGYLRFRFYGRSSVVNNNELQWTFNFKSRIMNGTAGLIGFFDNGRVWQPGEVSDTWHTSYGGGVMLAPFKKVVAAAVYGITKEGNRLNIRLGRMF